MADSNENPWPQAHGPHLASPFVPVDHSACPEFVDVAPAAGHSWTERSDNDHMAPGFSFQPQPSFFPFPQTMTRHRSTTLQHLSDNAMPSFAALVQEDECGKDCEAVRLRPQISRANTEPPFRPEESYLTSMAVKVDATQLFLKLIHPRRFGKSLSGVRGISDQHQTGI